PPALSELGRTHRSQHCPDHGWAFELTRRYRLTCVPVGSPHAAPAHQPRPAPRCAGGAQSVAGPGGRLRAGLPWRRVSDAPVAFGLGVSAEPRGRDRGGRVVAAGAAYMEAIRPRRPRTRRATSPAARHVLIYWISGFPPRHLT